MRVIFTIALALGCVFSSNNVSADEFKMLSADKGRVKFFSPSMTGTAYMTAQQDDSKNTLRLFDRVYFGNIDITSGPAFFAQYFTTSNAMGFSYSSAGDVSKGIFRNDKYTTTTTNGPKGSVPSAFGDVDFVSVSVERLDNGAKRDCAAWYNLFGGNRVGYMGIFCPAGHAPSIEEIASAVGAVTLK